jgi:hypothetical protein
MSCGCPELDVRRRSLFCYGRASDRPTFCEPMAVLITLRRRFFGRGEATAAALGPDLGRRREDRDSTACEGHFGNAVMGGRGGSLTCHTHETWRSRPGGPALPPNEKESNSSRQHVPREKLGIGMPGVMESIMGEAIDTSLPSAPVRIILFRLWLVGGWWLVSVQWSRDCRDMGSRFCTNRLFYRTIFCSRLQ